MPGKIELAVVPSTLTMSKGESGEATITLHNRGTTVDQLTISVEGIDPKWYTLPVSSVALFPNDKDALKIIVTAPDRIEGGATSFPLVIKASSQENPSETANANLNVQFKIIPKMDLAISPARITSRKGTYQISITNPGNAEARVRLKSGSSKNGLTYSLPTDILTLPANGHIEPTLEVRQGWKAWIFRSKPYDFEISAARAEDDCPETTSMISGQLVSLPWYRFLTSIKLPFISRPPVIKTYEVKTDNQREFKLTWLVNRANRVKMDNADIEYQGETVVRPSEPTKYVLTATNRYGTATKSIDVKPLPLPQARASTRIRVSLSSVQVKVQAGSSVGQLTIQVQNTGTIVDKFIVDIEGLDTTWFSRSASSIALMPQNTDQVQVMFQIQKKKGVRSGTYPFAVTVRSQSQAEDFASVVAQLEIAPSVEYKVKIHPYRVTGKRKGSFFANIANVGVTDANITFEATDLEEACRFQFKPADLLLSAWQSVEVPMAVRMKKRNSILGEPKRCDITVSASAEGATPQTANCEFNHKPIIKSWQPVFRMIKTVIVLVIIFIAGYYFSKLGGGWSVLTSSPQTWIANASHTIESWFLK
jgi:hypothetical protein